MQEYITTIGKNGRLVIPAEYRHLLHLDTGEQVVIRLQDGELIIFTLKHAAQKAQHLVRQYAKGKSLATKLKKMRQEDAKHDK